MLRYVTIIAVAASTVVGALGIRSLLTDENWDRLVRGEQLMASGKFGDAALVLRSVEGDPAKSATALEARLLLSRALVKAGKAKDGGEVARKLHESLPAAHPGRGRAHWLIAEAFEALGKSDESARVFAAEAAKVLGEGHRARVAGYYLTLASELEKPEKSDDPLKPGRPAQPRQAADLYGRALAELTGGKVRADVTLPRCRNLVAAGKQGGRRRGQSPLDVAASELEQLLKLKGLGEAAVAEARMLRAEALAGRNRHQQALTELARLLAMKNVAETTFEPRALELQGRTLLATGGGIERLREAVGSWTRFLERHPDHERAPLVRRLIARAWYDRGENEEAIKALTKVVADTLAKAADRASAAFEIAECERRLQRFDGARDALRRYLAAFPDDARVPQAQALIPELLLEKASVLRKREDQNGAVAAFRQYVEENPLSAKAAAVAVEIGLVLRDEKKISECAAAFLAARDRYRSHDRHQAARAGYLLGVVEEENKKDLEAAAKAYREVTSAFRGTAGARSASNRLARMEAVELDLSIPKMYAPGDAAKARLVVRNVKEATFRLYRLDARDYFERRGSLDGAADTEVALVKSDRTFTYEVPDWRRYRKDDLEVPIELEKGKPLPEGAWLVAVEAEERRSVVLMIVSSVRIVVKQSPTEVFCWATDARSGEPAKDVTVLVRGGPKPLELKTNASGVARADVKSTHRLRILALLGDGVAPGLAKAPGRSGKKGLTPRVAFTLDRPIYRPGATIRYRAVLRRPENGRWVTPEKEKVWSRLVDPRGRILSEVEVTSEAYGVVHGAFELPPEAVGDYRLELRFAKAVFQETVAVRAYKKPEYKVTVKPKARVVKPGSEVDCEVDVRYFFGGPVREGAFEWYAYQRSHTIDRDRYLAYSWYLKATEKARPPQPGSGWNPVASGAGSLDAEGKGRFTFASLLEHGNRRYLVQVRVRDTAGAWVSGSGMVYAGERDRFAVVLSSQKTHRAGDTAEIRVVTADLGHRSVAAEGRLKAFIQRRANGKTHLDEISDVAVDTGLQGEATLKVKLPRAGDWVVRFEGADGRGAPVTAETAIVVTGERPDLAKEAQLRFERDVYRAGETARAHLSVPVAKRPVLLTFEGEQVIDWKIVRPGTRAEVLEIAMADAFAPNVTAAVALPHDGKLLTSRDRIIVLRYLEVSVKPRRNVAGPKEKVTLDVFTRDQLGRPTPAGVVLRASDAALQGLGGNSGQDPRYVFNKDVRAHTVSTGSSFAFSFSGRTRFLDPDLVKLKKDEELRRRLESIEKDASKALAHRGFDGEVELEEMDSLEEWEESKGEKAGVPRPKAAARPAKPGGGVPNNGAPRSGGGGGGAVRGRGGRGGFGGGRGGRPGRSNRRKESGADRGGGGPGMELGRKLERNQRQGQQGGQNAENEKKFLDDRKVLGRSARFFADGDTNGDWRMATEGGFDSFGLMLQAEMVQPELRERFLEVAGWWPGVVTDARGEASVVLELPDNLTEWELLASGAARGVSVGQGTSSLKTTQDVLVRVERPRFLTSRDQVTVSTVVHSNLDEALAMKASLGSSQPTVLDAIGMTETSFELDAYGVARRDWRLDARGAGLVTLDASALSSRASDQIKRALPVVAFGEPWVHAASENLVDRLALPFDVPHDAVAGSTAATVIVEAGMEAEVLSGLQYLIGYPYGCLEQSLSRFVPAMLLARALQRAGRPAILERGPLDDMVRRGLNRIASFQTNDGGFSYWPGGAADPWVTAMCLETMIRARELSYAVPTHLVDSARRAARQMVRRGGYSIDARAALLLALVRSSDLNLDVLNALVRDRASLSVQGLSRLILACHRTGGRAGMVQTLFRELKERRGKTSADVPMPFRGRPSVPWLRSDLEASALALLAYEAAGADAAEVEGLVKSVRRGVRARAGGTKAVALGIEALTSYIARHGGIRAQGEVVVEVDGKEVARGQVGGETPVAAFEIPAELITKGKHEVRVTKRGGSESTCRLVVRNVRPADTVAAAGNVLEVSRRIIPYRNPDAKTPTYEPGYSIVQPARRPRARPASELTHAVEGRKVTIELKVTARENLEHVVIEEPQLAGLEVIESGVRGAFDRFERREAELLFFKNRLAKGKSVVFRYPAYAVYQGSFHGLPARAEEMYAPERWGRSASSTLRIVGDPSLLANVAPRDPTPDEAWNEGLRAYSDNDFAKAISLLAPLPGRWALRDDIHDTLLQHLLVAYLRIEQWTDAVRTREELRLRNPGKERLSVEDRERLGRAYLAVGDGWSARGHFQAVVLDAFEREMKVCDALRGLGRGAQAIGHTAATLVRYPPVSSVASHHASIAGWLLKERDPALSDEDAALLEGVRRMRWREALAAHLSVMAWHQGTALAEEAGFQRIALLRDLGDEKALIEECRRYLERHPKSGRADAAAFDLARASFARAEYDDATTFAKQVWEQQWLRRSGSNDVRYKSPHRWQAGYLLGRIAHVDGRYDEAVTWYGRVRDDVPDAQQSWLFFTQKELSVESLVRARPGGDVAVPFTAKNLEDVKALVYPVDLAVLFAMKKSFDKLSSAELAGIRPAQEASTKTRLAKYTRGTASVSLGKKDAGAYLVVLRSGDRTATTLVLVTDARLTVQRSGGSVRVYLVDGAGKPLPDANVKLGVGGRIFHSGRTDERGMLDVPDPGRGLITVVAEKDSTVAVGTHR